LYRTLLIAIVVAGTARHVRADARGVLRFGVMPLSLEPSSEMPLIGGSFDDAVKGYNAAALAYDRAHGTMAVATIDRSALGVHDTLMTFAPALELGGEYAVFRIEGIIGMSDTHRAIGIGAYPLDVSWRHMYLAAGGTASKLDRTDAGAEAGAMITARAALGARFGRVSFEIGYGAFVIGGLVDDAQLHSMEHYDPNGGPPPPADRVVAGGEQHGMIDVWLGLIL
jgi:hypothetical protein